MCSSDTLILKPNAYKAWVGGVSSRYGIEQNFFELRLNAIFEEDNSFLG